MKNRKLLLLGCFLTTLFVVWTFLVIRCDVQRIGPAGSAVGLATLNGWFHNLTGVSMELYTITDWLGIVPLISAGYFACMGLYQLITRRSFFNVDRGLYILGVFFLIVIGIFILFEKLAINYRPVLIDGELEASYPSSTTLLVSTVMPVSIMQFKQRFKNSSSFNILIAVFTLFMVIGRTVAGVHWLSDIIGSILISTAPVLFYAYACSNNLSK